MADPFQEGYAAALAALHITVPAAAVAEHPGWFEQYKTLLEGLSFVANISMPVVTAVALRFAYLQIVEATHSRTATLYGDVLTRWNAEDVLRSRKLLSQLARFYETNKAAAGFTQYASCPDYIRDALLHFRKNDPAQHNEYTAICDFLEYLGVMCRNRHIDPQQLFDFIGPTLNRYLGLLNPYFLAVRESVALASGSVPAGAVFAHAMLLHTEVAAFKPYTYPPSTRVAAVLRWLRDRFQR